MQYQRSLRARTAAAGARSTGSTEQPLHTNRQHNRQAEQTTAPGAVEDDPCPTQAPPPVLLDLIFSQPTPAEAAATLAAAGAIANDTAAPRATTAQSWGADPEDSDDGPPPGMIGSSGMCNILLGIRPVRAEVSTETFEVAVLR